MPPVDVGAGFEQAADNVGAAAVELQQPAAAAANPGLLADANVPAAGDVAVAAPVPWDVLYPKRSLFRDVLVQYALPRLLDLLRDPNNRLRSPRDLVNSALDQCRIDGHVFWGQFGTYTRKRSACDAIICHYFDTLHDYVSGRPVAA